VLTYISSFNLI